MRPRKHEDLGVNKEEPGMVVLTYNLGDGEGETGGFLWLTGQPV